MNSEIHTSAFERMTGRRHEWHETSFDQPRLMAESELTPLGSIKGRLWWSHRQLGELSERPKLLIDRRDILPDRPVIELEQDGVRLWRVFDGPFRPGSYEALTNTAVKLPRQPKPMRAFDALSFVWLADRKPETIFAPTRSMEPSPLSKGTRPLVKPAEPPARGAESILARLAAKGTTVTLSHDRQYLVPSSSGGVPGPGVIELLTTAAPLILAHLKGGPLLCAVGPHGKGDDPTATTLLVGGCPACARHVAEPIEAAS